VPIEIEETQLPGALVVRAPLFGDERGFFHEVYRQDTFEQAGLPGTFVQLNHSRSQKNVVRGLHFQWQPPQGKLMRVLRGAAFLVAVDIRKGSPTLGQWLGLEIGPDDRRQLWASAGFARGFCALTDDLEIEYLCTGTYDPRNESGILWNDPDIGIQWPLSEPILSPKDRDAQTLADWLRRPESDHFRWPEADQVEARAAVSPESIP
jgi:dTDP-4-dehydrorhamnose 3,5-epimerase